MKMRTWLPMIVAGSFAALSLHLALKLREPRAAASAPASTTPPVTTAPLPLTKTIAHSDPRESADPAAPCAPEKPYEVQIPDPQARLDLAIWFGQAKDTDLSPAVRRYGERTTRASLRKMYADFAKEAGLEPSRFAWLIDTLYTRVRTDHTERDRAEIDAEIKKQVAATLGEETAQRFQDYRESLSSRWEVAAYADFLERGDLPMSESQRLELQRFSAEDHVKFPDPFLRPVATRSIETRRAVYSQWREDRQVRIDEALRATLTDDQWQYVEDGRQWVKELNENFER